jgi:protein-S-isoprenylcysteine O-methyltransferase Ste14
MSWLLRLYPPAWRKRYGAEAAQLTAELVRQRDLTRRRAALDLVAGAALAWARVLNRPSGVDLAVRNAAFTIVVPGLGGFWLPWWLATRPGHPATPVAWPAAPVIVAGLAYAGAMAICFHLFVTGYEERALRRRFGRTYLEYRRTVPRWAARRPARG